MFPGEAQYDWRDTKWHKNRTVPLQAEGNLIGCTRRVFFTGHIPQVKVQVIMLQINKQDQMYLLALIITQNVL